MAADWVVVVYLAWFSAATHPAGLTTLRNRFGQRTQLMWFRLATMFCLLVALVIALVPTSYFNWNHQVDATAARPNSPALCYFSPTVAQSLWRAGVQSSYSRPRTLTNTVAMQAMIVGVLVLTISLASRCIKLFPRASTYVDTRLRIPLRNLIRFVVRLTLHSCGESTFVHNILMNVIALPAVGLYLCLRWTLDFYSSMLAEVRLVDLIASEITLFTAF